MKRFLFTVTLCILLCFPAISSATETITIASNTDSSPGWSEYSKHNGYILHIAKEAFATKGVQVEIKWHSSWKRAFEQAKNNEANSTCCWFFVDERQNDFYYSDPVVEETQVFFHLKSFTFDWNSIDDLQGLLIGGNTGFNYGGSLEGAAKSGRIKIDRARTYDQNLKKLLAGRIQVYPAAAITAFEHLNNMYPRETVDRFTYHPRPLLSKQLHLLLSKKIAEPKAKRVLSLFNEGLKEIRDNGLYDKIMKDAEKGVYKKMPVKWAPLTAIQIEQ